MRQLALPFADAPAYRPDAGLAEFIAVSRYCRYRPEWGRREIWPEAVGRVGEMHRRRFSALLKRRPGRVEEDADLRLAEEGRDLLTLGEEIDQIVEDVTARRILPSMRSLQFGGEALERHSARMFNCSYSPADRPEFFKEAIYLLLCGVGAGFSVQRQDVGRLPQLPPRGDELELPVRHFQIEDSIEGWADAVGALVESHYAGWLVEFDYSTIRPRGAPLRTAGGKAPGHLPLKRSLESVGRILAGAAGRGLRSIEVYDIVMHLAGAVLAGGVRRSATLCLFSADDDEMAAAKTGDWFRQHPHRAFSNNSAVLTRDGANESPFRSLFQHLRQFGEPGFYFTADTSYGANPCVEIGLNPHLKVTADERRRLQALGMANPPPEGATISGWQMCNLTTISGAAALDRPTFLRLCRQAALLGTLQAAYTDMDYLGPVTRRLNEREALLGVSICGILDRPDLLLDPETLEAGAKVVKATNARFAAMIGISPAARTTCVKPEGTASLLLGTGSGIHPHHARKYFRRVQVNRLDPVYRHFIAANPTFAEPSAWAPETDDVVTFPMQAPDGALVKADLPALEFLDLVSRVQRHWVEPGTAYETHSPGLRHNVSNTVSVSPDDWDAVADWIWEHRHEVTGLALLPDSGDKVYVQAPREEVTTEEDERRFAELVPVPVDYRNMRESTDGTRLREMIACAGGACDVA